MIARQRLSEIPLLYEVRRKRRRDRASPALAFFIFSLAFFAAVITGATVIITSIIG